MPTFTFDDVVLHYTDHGAGRPLVAVHGVWMSGRFFAGQAPLADRLRLVVPDLRGHGRSAKVRHGHTVAAYARDLHALLEHLGLRDVVLAGWSMGALVCWEYLRQFGQDRVGALAVLAEPPTEFAWPGWPHGGTTLAQLGEANAAIQEGYADAAAQFTASMFARPPADLAELVAQNLLVEPATASAIFVDMTLRDYRELLDEIRMPALLVFGRHDPFTSPAVGEHLRDALPDARLEILEHSADVPQLEEPLAVNAALLRLAVPDAAGARVRVVRAHAAPSRSPIQLAPGDRVRVEPRADADAVAAAALWPAFVWVVRPDGAGGWVPGRHLRVGGEDGGAEVVVGYDTTELSVERGAELTVREDDAASGWLWAVDPQGRQGWVPWRNVG